MTADPRTSRVVTPLFRLWSRVYDLPLFQLYYGRVHDRLLALAPARVDAALDVGCGTGELLVKLAQRWPAAQLAGIDLSAAMLAQAARKPFAAEVELIEGSVYELPFDTGVFDLVTNTLSSHFYLDLPAAADELARVTRPGGTLVMASLGNGPLRLLPGALGAERRTATMVHRAPREQRRILDDAGFDVERVESLLPIGWLYLARRR
ncbi:MAG: methyltransferase domain-containing protein [Myxococcales bacterium]|nr:methyltransferase domain-containing protein [Myxococcales bacterium]